jgi:hypothetical protein
LTAEQENSWISRINNFNNLFGDGGGPAISGFGRTIWTWDYTDDMFARFIAYVKDELINEEKKL